MCLSRFSRLHLTFALTSGVCLFFAGCGGGDAGPTKVAVSGTVTLDGAPLDHGTLLIKWKGNAAAGDIVNGTFTIPENIGPIPGKHRVEISSLEGGSKVTSTDPAKAMEEASGPPPTERIPANYNLESTLTAEVKAGGDALKFELKSAAK
ncbi:MAG: hypothetical protein ACKV2Q_36050 [Planctomycetaceae bacterium]